MAANTDRRSKREEVSLNEYISQLENAKEQEDRNQICDTFSCRVFNIQKRCAGCYGISKDEN